MTITKDAVIAGEKAFWEATMHRDAHYFQETLIDEALTIAGFGIADKKTVVASIGNSPIEYASYFMHDTRVLVLSPTSASISYRCVIQAAVAGHPHTIVINVTTVHVLRDGVLKIALHQQTPAQQ